MNDRGAISSPTQPESAATYNDRKKTLFPLDTLSKPGKPPVAILPMMLVLMLHLALALLWANKANLPLAQGAGQRYLTLTWLRAPRPRDPPPLPAPPRPAKRVPLTVAAPVPVASSDAPSPAAEPIDRTEVPQGDPAPLAPGQLMEAAKQQAGRVDRDLRAGKLAPLAPDRELPIARLRGALEDAYIDRSRITVTESMMQADGVVVYRFRRGDKIWCRQSGGIGSSIERSDGARLAGAGSAGGAGTAGTIPCPSGEAGWSRR